MALSWADVSRWESARIDDAVGAYRRSLASVEGVSQDLERALNGFVSQGEGAEAMREKLHERIGAVDEFAQVLEALISASVRTSGEVAGVRSLVLAAIRLADSYGLVIGADGTVGVGASWVAPWSYSEVEAAELQAAHVIEVEEVDAQYSRVLSVSGEESWGWYASSTVGLIAPGMATMFGLAWAAGLLEDERGDQSWWWSRSSRRDARLGRGDDESADSPQSGQANKPGGLGKPVAGTSAPIPKIFPWKYQGDSALEGAGRHGQRAPGLGDYAVHEAATSAADVMAPMWPDASKNLLHFLGNSGAPLDINVDRMLEDLPEFQEKSDGLVRENLQEAINDSLVSGFSGPVTYPFTTDWDVHYAEKRDDANWFYATGGYSYALAGTVTVYPPDETSSDWRHEVAYQVHVADRYNWDGLKQTQIGPLTVTDAELAELHRAGIAQEFDLVGRSSVRSEK